MNRILSIAILLLTLLTAVEVKAQPMTNETGYKCNDGGFEYISPIPCDYVAACREQCSSCDNFFDCDEIAEHEKDCYYECPLCNEQMPVNEQGGHHCESTCGVCGMPMTQCVCFDPYEGNDPYSGGGGNGFPNQYLPNVTVKGKNKSGSSLNWWEIVTIGGSATPPAGGGGGGGSSQSQNNNSSDGKLTIQNVLDLLNGMPGKFYELLKELYDAEKIVYVESLKNARYFQESKTLKIGPNYTLDVVTHELIHYLQDKMGMLDFDNSSSNNEFQTYLLNYIYGWSYGLPAPPMGLSNDTEWWNELQLKIADFVEMESTTISKEILDILNGIDYNIRVKKFSDYYKEISKDWDLKPASNWNSYNENYNYRWKEFMEEIGFNFK